MHTWLCSGIPFAIQRASRVRRTTNDPSSCVVPTAGSQRRCRVLQLCRCCRTRSSTISVFVSLPMYKSPFLFLRISSVHPLLWDYQRSRVNICGQCGETRMRPNHLPAYHHLSSQRPSQRRHSWPAYHQATTCAVVEVDDSRETFVPVDCCCC